MSLVHTTRRGNISGGWHVTWHIFICFHIKIISRKYRVKFEVPYVKRVSKTRQEQNVLTTFLLRVNSNML